MNIIFIFLLAFDDPWSPFSFGLFAWLQGLFCSRAPYIHLLRAN